MTPALRWPLLSLAAVLALALLAVFVAPQAEANHDPDPPQNLRVSSDTADTLVIAWNPPVNTANVNHYHAERKRSSDTVWGSGIVQSASQTRTITFRNLNADTSYDIRIQSCQDPSLQHCGSWVQISHSTEPVALSMPTNLGAATTSDSVTLNWNPPANASSGENIFYDVDHKRASSSNWINSGDSFSSSTNVSKTIFSLTTNAAYDFRVRACRTSSYAGCSGYATRQATPSDAPSLAAQPTGDGRAALFITRQQPGTSSYRIEWKKTSDTNWSGAGSKDVTSADAFITEEITGLDNHASYDFRARTTASGTNSAWSDVFTLAGKPDGLNAPTATSVNGIVAIDVAWTAPTNNGGKPITGYSVQWREHVVGNWGDNGPAGTKNVGADVTTLRISSPDLSAGTNYNFRISATNENRRSFWTPNNESVAAMTAVIPPTNVRARPGGNRELRVDWDQVTGATGYKVQYKSGSQNYDPGRQTTITGGGTTTTTFSNLSNGTEYTVRVIATSAGGDSAPSEEATGTPIGTPGNFRVDGIQSTRFNLRWNASTGAVRYFIEGRPAVTPRPAWGRIFTTNTSQAIINSFGGTSITPGTEWEARIRACLESVNPPNDDVCGRWSSPALAFTTTALVPNVPGNFQASDLNNNNDGNDRLTWDAVTNTGGVTYEAQRRQAGQPHWEGAVAATGTSHDFAKASGTSGSAYDYRVRATTTAGNSDWTSHMTVAGRPGGISDLSATASTSAVAVALSWTAPSTGGKDLTGYRVEWREDVSGGDWNANPALAHTTAPGDVSTFTVNAGHGLQTGTTYDFRIRADNPDRSSFYSNTADADQATVNIGATASPSTLTEGELNGARLDFNLIGTQLITPFSTANFALESAPAGLSITDVLVTQSNTQARLILGFTGDIASDTSFVVRMNADRNQANTALRATVQVTAEMAPAVVVTTSARGGAGTVTVNWNAVSDADGYKVQWKGPGATFNTAPQDGRELVITDGDTTTAVIGGLEPSTVYFVRVIATKNLAPDGPPSLELSATTAAISAVISSPSSLLERTLDGGTVTVDLVGTTYASSLDPSDFGLLPQGVRGLSITSVSRQSSTRAVLTLGFTGNIVANVSLQVVVDGSANAAGSQLTSDTVTVIQAATPAKVSGVGAEPGPASLTVTWRAVGHADGYRVSVRRSADTSDVTIRDIAGGSATRVGISGLLGDTGYDVRVRALSDFATEGAWSNSIRATTLPGHAIVSSTDPSPLTEGNLDGAVLTVDLLPGVYDPWAPALDRAELTVTGVPGVTATIADVTRVSDERLTVRLSYDDTDFDNDRLLRVAFTLAHTSIGTITAVAPVTAVLEAAPGRVQNVQVTPGPLKVRVTWDPVDGATGYRLEWSPAAAFGSSVNVRPTRYTIGALLPGTEYTVRVVATKTRAPDGQRSAAATATTPAFGARLVRTDPSPLTEENLHGARLTVDVQGVEWERLVEGRYYRSQLGWLNDCSQAKYYDNCYPFIVTRSVVVTGIERVSSSRVVVSLWARNVNLQGNGLWIRFPDDMHTHYYGEDDFIVLQVIAPDEPDRTDFEIAQNNRAGVTVTAADPVSVAEGGASASYTVALDGQPSGDVVIVTSSDNGDVTTQPASLTFTRDNWETPQTVTVRAAQDDDAVDDSATIGHTVSGAQGYAGIDVASVSVSVADDDEAGVTVHPTSLNVDEGGSANYTVVLDAQPVSNVVIYVSDGNGVTVQPSSLTFTPDNWQTAQTVTVSGAQDNDTDDETAYVTHSILADAGSAYVGVLASYVEVSVADDDEAQAEAAQQEPEPETGSVTVSANSLGVREGDDGATYAVVLDVEPTANVVVTVSSDNGDVAAEPGSLTFTPGNWQSGQTVTVSAGEDEDREDELAIVSHGASGGNYDGVTVGFVTVIVTDDDSTVEALRDFYEAAGGGSWSNNDGWLSGRPLAEWHGVTVNEDGEVTGLALRDNNLVGTLAPELGKLERLEVLSLDRNGIGGNLPVELGDLSNLTRLAMNRNSLTGAIPSELGGLTNLSIIGLARNQLSGGLPASLGNLSGLTRLSLHDNAGLSGALPSGFTGLVNLERLAIANTGLCAPDDEGFSEWLDGVADKPGGVQTCE